MIEVKLVYRGGFQLTCWGDETTSGFLNAQTKATTQPIVVHPSNRLRTRIEILFGVYMRKLVFDTPVA
ncbi:hypothetical protein Ptc2401_01786 [Prosthecochloris sp. CIB 2401]|nr:hypothetical protein Ptc2401_01786 [Prosthecochloris sp. CIB 2401]